jgi:hypothetical protein
MAEPKYKSDTRCPYCTAQAVALVLDSPNQERVIWCSAGHVLITMQGISPKLVYNFVKEHWQHD